MINKYAVDKLRLEVENVLSRKRFQHTLGVEKTSEELASYFLADSVYALKSAALLHDITKELTTDEQIEILMLNNLPVDEFLISSPQVLHSLTAPYVIKEKYSEFAVKQILSSVEKHTLGSKNMSVFDEIIFISDYIEEGRTHESCKKAREFLFENLLKNNNSERRIFFLHRACVMSIDFTIENLTKNKRAIHPRMIEARKALNDLALSISG